MDNAMMAIIGGLAILVIFYFVVSFFSGKTWKIPHVLLAVCVFFASGVFVFLAAGTLKTHDTWRKIYLDKKQELAQQLHDIDLLAKGYAKDLDGNYKYAEDSVIELKQALGQELYDRARVWRNVEPGAFDGNTVSVTVPVPDVQGGAPELLIPESAILYAFKEREEPENKTVPVGDKVPYAYLGEFSVASKTGNSLVLRPTLPLDATQRAEVNNPNNTWVLYDLMPVDSYYAFHDLFDLEKCETFVSTNDIDDDGGLSNEEFTRGLSSEAAKPEEEQVWFGDNTSFDKVDENNDGSVTPEEVANADFESKIRAVMHEPPRLPDGSPHPDYEVMIAEYSRDRRPADETKDAPARIWKTVRFQTDEHDPIKVDSDDESPQAAMRYFDATGRAVPASLRMGEFNELRGEFEPGEIEFEIGDVALLDKETADRLIDQDVCEEVEQIYIRELRDYAYDFHEIYGRFISLADDARRIEVDIGSLEVTNANADLHVTYRQGEQAELESDLNGMLAEQKAVTDYLAALTAQWNQLRQDLSLLYRTNNALAAELANYQAGLKRSIDAKTNVTESTAEAPQAPTPP